VGLAQREYRRQHGHAPGRRRSSRAAPGDGADAAGELAMRYASRGRANIAAGVSRCGTRKEYRRQHGHAPGTATPHLVTAPTPASSPAARPRKPRRRSSRRQLWPSSRRCAAGARGRRRAGAMSPTADQVARRAHRVRTVGEVEIRRVGRADIPAIVEEEAAPAPMIEVAPGRFVNADRSRNSARGASSNR
jgi:hypothetical protein